VFGGRGAVEIQAERVRRVLLFVRGEEFGL